MKINNFVKGFKKSKIFKSGDTIELYKNTYTILTSNDTLTLLQDSRGTPTAYPTEKVRAMILKKELKKTVVTNENPNIKVGNTQATDRTKSSVGMPTGPKSDAPSGTMHAGMIKITKPNPKQPGKMETYWVHGLEGTKHADHEGSAHHDPIHHKVTPVHRELKRRIINHLDESKHENAMKVLDDYAKQKSMVEHLRDGHQALSAESNTKVSSTMRKYIDHHDTEAFKKQKKLVDFLEKEKRSQYKHIFERKKQAVNKPAPKE